MTEHINGKGQIVTAEHVGSKEAARWLSNILGATYGHHNLMASVDQTQQDIAFGRIQPFFTIEDGIPVNCCALIQGPSTVEIGRAANAPGKNGGGKLMLHAVNHWKSNLRMVQPLVAEIRMASPYIGIAGGQGSQATLLNPEKVGMSPRAFLPAFHHPGPRGPDRQELFCFSVLEKEALERVAPEKIELPQDPRANLDLLRALLAINGFRTEVSAGNISEREVNVEQKMETPFNLFVANDDGISIAEFPIGRQRENPFDLVAVSSFDEGLGAKSMRLFNNGFQLAGISAPHEGALCLLFGRLGNCLLAPTEPMRDFPFIRTELIAQIDEQFRRV